MKRILLCTFVLTAFTCSSQDIYWDFVSALPATVGVAGVTVSEISHGNNNGNTTLISGTSPSSAYTNASGGNNAAAAARTGGFSTSSSGSTYFEFTLTPATGSIVKLNSVSFGSRSTTTGPIAFSLRSNIDAYSSDVATGSLSNNSVWALISISSLSVTGSAGSAITFRLYGYNGEGPTISGNANWRIDDVTLNVTVTAAAPLPVQFGTVKAMQIASGVSLQWSNLAETDVTEYVLERSASGKDYYALQRISALVNSGSQAHYQLLDPSPISGRNFYRIKAVETSGKIVYSGIIRLNLGHNNILLTLYPNPVKGNQIGVQMENLPPGLYSMKIFNSLGQAVVNQSVRHSGGHATQTVSLKNLKPGMYILTIEGNITLQSQFSVQ